jgi:branched-chain amino acid transport system permease protein
MIMQRAGRGWLGPVALTATVTLAAALIVPSLVNGYWLYTITTGVISILLMQSLGVTVGRAGTLALCTLSFAGVGAWVTQWCNVHAVPGGFYVWLLLGALAAVPVGLLVGSTALRLRGPTLAVATFAVATTTDVIWGASQFPGEASSQVVLRPSALASDGDFFVAVLVVVAVMFLALRAVDRSRLGAAWVEARFSERAAAAHGVSVPLAKLSAFAAGAFIAGLGGALMAAQQGIMTGASFTAIGSVTLFALAVMLGVHHAEAAALGGLAFVVMPALLTEVGISGDVATIAFGVLAVFVLRAGKGQMGQSDMMRARRRAARAGEARATRDTTPRPRLARRAPDPDAEPALQVEDLTVRFGAVTAVDGMSLAVPAGGIVALIGPNGAGKSTFINAVTGFVPVQSGRVTLGGRELGRQLPHRLARSGVRRSFQQLQVAPGLTVGMYLRIVAGRRMTEAEVEEQLALFECPPADVYVGAIDVGARRILEVAGLAASGARVVLLDEPAAGQAAADSARLAARISEIPARTGSSVLLVEHDMALVRETCDALVVMDAGRPLAAGEPNAVLADPAVIEAYLGTPPAQAPVVPASPAATTSSKIDEGEKERA